MKNFLYFFFDLGIAATTNELIHNFDHIITDKKDRKTMHNVLGDTDPSN